MNFKAIGLVTLSLALAFPVFAQGPRGRRGGPGGPPPGGFEQGQRPGASDGNRLDRLTEALDLTASQVASLEALTEQRQSAQEGYREQMQEAQEAFRAAAESGDATAIGNAFLARKALQEEARAINEEFMAQFRSLLTLD